jgi:hypothetical protein
MLNLPAIVKQLFSGQSQGKDEWIDDPLSHPALQRMTLEHLADLPFDRGTPADRRTSCATKRVRPFDETDPG